MLAKWLFLFHQIWLLPNIDVVPKIGVFPKMGVAPRTEGCFQKVWFLEFDSPTYCPPRRLATKSASLTHAVAGKLKGGALEGSLV